MMSRLHTRPRQAQGAVLLKLGKKRSATANCRTTGGFLCAETGRSLKPGHAARPTLIVREAVPHTLALAFCEAFRDESRLPTAAAPQATLPMAHARPIEGCASEAVLRAAPLAQSALRREALRAQIVVRALQALEARAPQRLRPATVASDAPVLQRHARPRGNRSLPSVEQPMQALPRSGEALLHEGDLGVEG